MMQISFLKFKYVGWVESRLETTEEIFRELEDITETIQTEV